MSLEDGFRPCIIDGAPDRQPRYERTLLLCQLVVHLTDVALDILVAVCFLFLNEVILFSISAMLLMGTCAAAMLFVKRAPSDGFEVVVDVDNDEGESALTELAWRVARSIPPLQVIGEAYLAYFDFTSSARFYQIRLVQVVGQALPSSLLQFLVLTAWADAPGPKHGLCAGVLQLSVVSSIVSVGIGLAAWEHQVQVIAPCRYISCTAVVRLLELTSRCSTLAFFSLAARLSTAWVLLGDYLFLVLLIMQHRPFQIKQGLLMAVPLVLVSFEPFVWQRSDHVVPKDVYYALRLLEFTLCWIIGIFSVAPLDAGHCHGEFFSSWLCSGLTPIMTSLPFFIFLPIFTRWSERWEVSQDAELASRQCFNTTFQRDAMDGEEEVDDNAMNRASLE
mmetsp:Transcript_68477/g.164441  ORF Transcript_68477/g.164441 Transcript_68477/m.164441 type:complete len:391 (-) Transcript_68477:81-1253(-)